MLDITVDAVISLGTSGPPTLLLILLKQHIWVVASTTIMNKQKRLQTPPLRKWNDTLYLNKIMKHDTYDLQYSGLALMVAWLSISCHAWSNVRPSVLSPSSAKYTISFAAECAEFARSNFTAACWVSCKACTVTWNSFTNHHIFHYNSYYYIYSNLTDFSNTGISTYKVTNPPKSSRNLDISFSLQIRSSIRTVLCNIRLLKYTNKSTYTISKACKYISSYIRLCMYNRRLRWSSG